MPEICLWHFGRIVWEVNFGNIGTETTGYAKMPAANCGALNVNAAVVL